MDITIKLEAFEGPLDLLYHLIEKNEINIYDIPIASLTDQYLQYLASVQERNLENMSEFLVMAASLLEIKSKMLLPSPKVEKEEYIDPREELVNKLLEYKKFKHISEQLKEREREAEKILYKESTPTLFLEQEKFDFDVRSVLDGITLQDIFRAFEEVVKRRERKTDKVRSGFKSIQKDLYTIDEKITYILDLLILMPAIKFQDIFREDSDKMEVVVTFLALLELIKMKKVHVQQKNVFDDILIIGYSGRDEYETD